MFTDTYNIDHGNYLKRKENFEKRVEAIIAYAKNSVGCRSKYIAAYFTDEKLNSCGICDNCINEKLIQVTAEEFKNISSRIFEFAEKTRVNAAELLLSLTDINKQKVWKVLDYLQAENKLGVDKEGNISVIGEIRGEVRK